MKHESCVSSFAEDACVLFVMASFSRYGIAADICLVYVAYLRINISANSSRAGSLRSRLS